MSKETEVCPGCGSTAEIRKQVDPDALQELIVCPHCGNLKCCMCDMGDDVECPSCEVEE